MKNIHHDVDDTSHGKLMSSDLDPQASNKALLTGTTREAS